MSTPAAARCSELSLRAGEQLAGTAPLARTWVVLEQPGPYGPKTPATSHLSSAVSGPFLAAAEGTGVTVVLARPVGPHPDDHAAGPRRFWVAHAAPGGVRMRAGVLDDLRTLVTRDLPDLLTRAGRGELPPWGHRSDEPLLLVCTNARRDQCCALAGRPLAAALADDPAYAGHVLEASHVGGHRFAPTALLLPTGAVYGRVGTAEAGAVLDAARRGELSLAGMRGRTALPAPLQVADVGVRAAYGITAADALDVLHEHPGGTLAPAPLSLGAGDVATPLTAQVRHRDGRSWRVHLEPVALAPRPESCGKAPVPGLSWVATGIEPAADWTAPAV